MTRRWGRRRRNLLDGLRNRRGYSHLKEEALDRTVWRNHFGGGFGPVVRQNTEWMNCKLIYVGKKKISWHSCEIYCVSVCDELCNIVRGYTWCAKWLSKFQASTTVYMKYSLFWYVIQHRLAVRYRCFGTTCLSHRLGSNSWTTEDRTDRLSQNIGNYQCALCNIWEERRF